MSKYTIGLFGFGCVGKGLYETLKANHEVDANIVKICVKNRDKVREGVPADILTYDQDSILNDDDINVVVELIDDADAAYAIVKRALKSGKAVVTANKKMVAEHLEELIALQEEYKTPLLYEGAVCGSIPIIRNLEDYYASEQISEVKGIFNGSSNYILTQLFQGGQTYEDALKDAQEKGFAETDPTLDVGGFDPKFKLSIVIRHAFGLNVQPEKIFNWGIQNISKEDIEFATEQGLKIKLLAKAHLQGDVLSVVVAPHFIDSNSPLYHVENEYNCVLINGAYAENQTLIGKGAGSLPTGLAVLADVVSLTKGYNYQYRTPVEANAKGGEVNVYLRAEDIEKEQLDLFNEVSEKFSGKGHSYVIGTIDVDNLSKILSETSDSNVIFTGDASVATAIPKLTYSYV